MTHIAGEPVSNMKSRGCGGVLPLAGEGRERVRDNWVGGLRKGLRGWELHWDCEEVRVGHTPVAQQGIVLPLPLYH